MAREIVRSPFGAQNAVVWLDSDTTYQLPTANQAPLDTTLLVDNLKAAPTVVVSGQFASGTSFSASGGAGWALRFTWTGLFYVVG